MHKRIIESQNPSDTNSTPEKFIIYFEPFLKTYFSLPVASHSKKFGSAAAATHHYKNTKNQAEPCEHWPAASWVISFFQICQISFS